MHGRDVATQVVNPLAIMDSAVLDDIGKGRPILGDHQRENRELAVDGQQQLLETVGGNVPAHVRVGPLLWHELDRVRTWPWRSRRGLVPVGTQLLADAVPKLNGRRGVVVDPQDIDGLVDEFGIALLDEGPVGNLRGVLQQVRRVGTMQHRAGEGPIGQRVDATDSFGPAVSDTTQRMKVEGDRVLRIVFGDLAQLADREAVRKIEVMNRLQGLLAVGSSRGVGAGAVAEVRGAPRLVQGGPGFHAIPETGTDHGGVPRETEGGLAVRPSTCILKGLRQIPVVERGDGLDTASDQPVDQGGVEVDTRLVDRPRPGRNDARPGDRESIGLQAQARHQVEIFLEAMVVIVGDVSGVSVHDQTRGVAERVPDRRAPAVLVPGALDLVRRRRRAEDELRREDQSGIPVVCVACTHSVTSASPVVVATACPPTTLTDHLLADGELTLARPADRWIVKTALSPPGVVTVTWREPSRTPGSELGYSSRVNPSR